EVEIYIGLRAGVELDDGIEQVAEAVVAIRLFWTYVIVIQPVEFRRREITDQADGFPAVVVVHIIPPVYKLETAREMALCSREAGAEVIVRNRPGKQQ